MPRFDRCRDGAGFVHRLADDVHDATQRFVAHRHGDRLAGVFYTLAAHETFGRVHGDCAHEVFTEMLRNLEHQPVPVIVRFERVQNSRQVLVELNVDDSADNLCNAAFFAHGVLPSSLSLLKRVRTLIFPLVRRLSASIVRSRRILPKVR